MEQLLRINSSKAILEYKTTNASLNHKYTKPSVDITRDKGGLSIQSNPSRIIMDSFEARDSVRPSTSTIIKQFANEGVRAGHEATARYAAEGDELLTLHLKNDPIISNIQRRLERAYEFGLTYIPNAKVNIDFTKSELIISYDVDKLNFSWQTDKEPAIFNKGSIEFSMKSYGEIQIEYIGKDNYTGNTQKSYYA